MTAIVEHTYPDGGKKAWLVVLGAWCAMIPSMGLLNSLAVLHAWLSENQLKEYSESTVGWIFSSYAFFLFFCGAQIGPLFDKYEMRGLIIVGTVGNVLALVFMSLSSEFYQFFLSFGVLGGISGSFLYNPALSAIGHWFNKRRSLAIGLACTSGGVGGVWMPLVVLCLTPNIGFNWSIRIIALLCLAHGVVASVLLTKRIPPSSEGRSSVDFRALREINYAAVTVGMVLIEFAIFLPITYICSYAIRYDFDYIDAYMLNALLNAGAIPGRLLPNYAAGRFGVLNTLCIISFFCMVSIFGLWLPAQQSRGLTTAFAVIYGFWSGASVSLAPVAISLVCKTEDLGKRNGTAYTLASVGTLIGIPIGGAILGAENGSYQGLIVFSGLAYFLALVSYGFCRFQIQEKSR